MVTLEETLQLTHDWAVDRIHTLCDREDQDLLLNIEDAHAKGEVVGVADDAIQVTNCTSEL